MGRFRLNPSQDSEDITAEAFLWVYDLPKPLPLCHPPSSPASPPLSSKSLLQLFCQVSLTSCIPSQVTGNPCSVTLKIATPFHIPHVPLPAKSLRHFQRISKGPTEDFLRPCKPGRWLHRDPAGPNSIQGSVTSHPMTLSNYLKSSDSGFLPPHNGDNSSPQGFHKSKCIHTFTQRTLTESLPCSETRVKL